MKLPTALLLAALLHASPGHADERIRGSVLDTKVTYCEADRRAGCTGRLTLQRELGGQSETITIHVPLGTPISKGCDTVPLHRLPGKKVIVTEGGAANSHVARAIQALEDPESAC